MASPDDPQGAKAPDAGAPSESEPVVGTVESSPADSDLGEKPGALVAASSRGNGGSNALPPPSPPEDEEEDEGMLRMSFLEHLEELRTRLIRMLMGIAVAF